MPSAPEVKGPEGRLDIVYGQDLRRLPLINGERSSAGRAHLSLSGCASGKPILHGVYAAQACTKCRRSEPEYLRNEHRMVAM
jgi:hypothetical protein